MKPSALFVLLIPGFLSSPLSYADDRASEDRRLIEAFFEHSSTTPAKLRQFSINVLQDPKLEIESFRIQGPYTLIPPTAKRVKGHNPSCEIPEPTADERLGSTLKDLGWGAVRGSVYFWPVDPTYTVSGIIASVGLVVASAGKLIGDKSYQEYGNCAMACATVPGTYGRDELSKIASVRYQYIRDLGTPARELTPGDDGDWFVSSDWVTANISYALRKSEQPAVFQSVLIKQRNGFNTPSVDETEIPCPTTLVCTQAKNWSANLIRSISVSVTLDARYFAPGACVDASLVNREKYSSQIARWLDPDFIAVYYAEQRERAVRNRPTR